MIFHSVVVSFRIYAWVCMCGVQVESPQQSTNDFFKVWQKWLMVKERMWGNPDTKRWNLKLQTRSELHSMAIIAHTFPMREKAYAQQWDPAGYRLVYTYYVFNSNYSLYQWKKTKRDEKLCFLDLPFGMRVWVPHSTISMTVLCPVINDSQTYPLAHKTYITSHNLYTQKHC